MKNLADLAGTVTLTKDVRITEEDIDNIFETAVNGAISYWCPDIQMLNKTDEMNGFGKHLNAGGEVLVYEDVEESMNADTWEKHRIILDDVLLGIGKYINGEYSYSLDIVENDNGVLVLDCYMIDADVADAILQLSVFGEIVYG